MKTGAMKALVYTGPYGLEMREAPMPVPGPGEVLIKVEAVGICGSDMHAYHGQDARRPPPLILGHEAAGRIVGGLRDGQRVTINPLVVDPDCPYAKEGRAHLSPTRQIISMPPRNGAFAEYVTIPERNVVAIPDSLPIAQAALAEPIAVSWHAVRIGIEKMFVPVQKARVVVLGGGAIGLAAAICARHFGARDVQVGETNALRRSAFARMPDISAYTPGETGEPQENSVDLVIDAVGANATRAAASKMIRPGGVIVHVGLLPGAEGLDIRKITLQEVTLSGSYCYTHADFVATVDALIAGSLGALDWFETRPLDAGLVAFADIDANRVAAAKIVLIP